jgi:hypothetical protein
VGIPIAVCEPTRQGIKKTDKKAGDWGPPRLGIGGRIEEYKNCASALRSERAPGLTGPVFIAKAYYDSRARLEGSEEKRHDYAQLLGGRHQQLRGVGLCNHGPEAVLAEGSL